MAVALLALGVAVFPASPALACIGCAGMYSDFSITAEIAYLVNGIHASMMETMRDAALAADSGMASSALLLPLGMGFSYGALHALGPGHGKVVVAGFFAGTPSPAREALRMAGEIAVLHVGSAFLLAVVAALLLEGTLIASGPAFDWVRLASYGLIAGAGGLMLYRAAVLSLRLRGIYLPLPSLLDTQGCRCGRDDGGTHDHHHPHAEKPKGRFALSVAVGAVPCTGALIAVMFSLASGAWMLGILMVAAISIGMGLTLAAVGLGTIWTRGQFAISGGTALRSLEVFGALAVIAAGGLLFYGTAVTL